MSGSPFRGLAAVLAAVVAASLVVSVPPAVPAPGAGAAPAPAEPAPPSLLSGASSDAVGLEDFYPYRSWDLGSGTAYVNLATGNLVVQESDFDIPGAGLGLRLSRTYNSVAAEVDGP
ncbi:MAG: DUF6531 domain-containing protein, partial [Candidatus Methylomirabilales bacterium]